MSIPELNDDDTLPSGIHETTLDEVQQRFGQFQSSARRCRLFGLLKVML